MLTLFSVLALQVVLPVLDEYKVRALGYHELLVLSPDAGSDRQSTCCPGGLRHEHLLPYMSCIPALHSACLIQE